MALDRLEHNVVHEICTNQVVVTLHACVKELVENSLDAGAKRVELRLRESGSELLELVDDGHGISSENYERLAMRHATSKIREYDDLSRKLSTFGFRGEALSAICAMGDVTVCTRTEGDAAATLLTYDRFGKLVSQAPAAREVGTTVSVKELFKRLPVRHREFLRNAKAQVSATLRLLQAFAIAQPEIRFHVLAEKMRGHGAGRATLMSSSGSAQGWKQAAAAVLGDAVLVDVEPMEIVGESSGWTISGLISKPVGGRRSRDMQLFFCNRRPIDPPKRVVKLINDTFHQYNSRMWPVAILSFSASQNLVDVNVTPDKRTVFFHNEEELLKDIQEKLTDMYASVSCDTGSVTTLSSFGIRSMASQSSVAASTMPTQSSLGGFALSASNDVNSGSMVSETQEASTQEVRGVDFNTTLSVATIDLDSADAISELQVHTPGNVASSRECPQEASSMQTPEKLMFGGATGGSTVGVGAQIACNERGQNPVAVPSEIDIHMKDVQVTELLPSSPSATALTYKEDNLEGLAISQIELERSSHDGHGMEIDPLSDQPYEEGSGGASDLVVMDYSSITNESIGETGIESSAVVSVINQEGSDPDERMRHRSMDMLPLELEAPSQDVCHGSGLPTLPEAPAPVGTLHTSVSLAQLRAAAERRRHHHAATASNSSSMPTKNYDQPCPRFPSAFSLSSLRSEQGSASLDEVAKFATDEGFNATQSSPLRFDKSCFSQMRVIGQFNLGFIIASLQTKRDDEPADAQDSTECRPAKRTGLQLFIIDQHASDEKFRFEGLNRESKIDRQPLVNPHFLQLNPAQEQLAESHLGIFKLNGFEIKKDDSRPPGRRLQLLTLPTCQGLMFGDKDVHELLYTLEQAESDRGEIRVQDASKASSGLLDLAGHRGLWSSTAVPRPPKVWKLMASRACRSAIMVGKALRVSEMEKVVANLGMLQQPWNCPHGRPTLRHLIDTSAAWQSPPRSEPLAAFLKAGHSA
jgi:DNA mismatch repair protein PMS2